MKTASCHPDRAHRSRGLCGPCYYEQWKKDPANRERLCSNGRAYYRANRDRIIAGVNARWAAKPQDIRERDLRAKRIKARYQITPAEYDQMVIAQGGKCAICDKPFKVIDIDHDHATGAVRGLLCRACNLGVAVYEKHSEALVRYLHHASLKAAA